MGANHNWLTEVDPSPTIPLDLSGFDDGVVLFNDGGSLGGDSAFTFDKTTGYFQVGPTTALANDNFAALWSFGNANITECPGGFAGGMYVDFEGSLEHDDDTFSGLFVRTGIAGESTHTGLDLQGITIYASNRGSGLLTSLEGLYVRYQTLTDAHTATQSGIYASPLIVGAVDANASFYAAAPIMIGGTAATNTAFYAQSQIAAGITNAYAFWHDAQGVYRIKEDNTFDSVYQAIPALYNPQITKYTPGASNYERGVQQWHGNVFEMGTEKGGTGTLRGLRFIGSEMMFRGANAAPADGDLAAGDMGIWFDQSNGAAKFMVKAKQADGTVKTGSFNVQT